MSDERRPQTEAAFGDSRVWKVAPRKASGKSHRPAR